MNNATDPKCSTCAFCVNELRRTASPYEAGTTMVCLHRDVGRQDCRNVRLAPGGKCGPDAGLWMPHATRAKQAEPRPMTAADMRQAAAHDTSCVGAFARARPGAKP
jgi:hypothetical protein